MAEEMKKSYDGARKAMGYGKKDKPKVSKMMVGKMKAKGKSK